MDDRQLRHWGVLGMKWGVRRSRGSTSNHHEEHIRAHSLKRKGYKNLSNKELQDVLTRMDLENRYKQANPSSFSVFSKQVTNIITGISTSVKAINTLGSAYQLGKKFYDAYKKVYNR